MPCVEEVEEGSSRLAYKVRAALAGLLELSDAIRERKKRADFCAMCYEYVGLYYTIYFFFRALSLVRFKENGANRSLHRQDDGIPEARR